jgi:hypothetical protein
MLVGTPHGTTYTHTEVIAMLAECGFVDTQVVALAAASEVVLGAVPKE